MYVNVLVYEIQRGLDIAQIEQIELYRLPQKVTTVCFILRKNLQVTDEVVTVKFVTDETVFEIRQSPEDSFSR